jgi:drug/metabolite transporter (DMT)-like permease
VSDPERNEAQDSRRQQKLAVFASFGLVLLWGANFSIQKTVFATLGPGPFLFARYLILPSAAYWLLRQRGLLRLPTRDDFWALGSLGLKGHLLHVGFVTWGIYWSTPFSSALILACGPVFTLLILRATGVETPRRSQTLGVALALLGVIVFLSDKLLLGRWSAGLGDLVLLGAAALFSWYTVSSKPLVERLGSAATMGWSTLLGSLPVLIVSAHAGLTYDWYLPGPIVWAGLLWSVLVASFAGWLVWAWVNAVRGVAKTAPLMYLMPPVAGAVSWVLGGESFTVIQVAGALIALAGVGMAQFGRQFAQRFRAPTPV